MHTLQGSGVKRMAIQRTRRLIKTTLVLAGTGVLLSAALPAQAASSPTPSAASSPPSVAPSFTSAAGSGGAGDSGQPRVSSIGWSFEPASTQGQLRSALQFMVARGQVIHDSIVLKNPLKRPLTVTLYTADGYNLANGGAFAFTTAKQKPTRAGSWITLAANEVTVPSGKQATVPVTITIPTDASPGQLAGGVVAQDTAITQAIDKNQVHVGVRVALGVRVYLQVAGALHPRLAVDDVHVTRPGISALFFGGGRATVHYTVINSGNQTLNATADARVVDTFGHTVRTFPQQKLIGLLPNARVQFADDFTASRMPGRYRVLVDVHSDAASAHGATSMMVVPLGLVLAILLAAAIIVVWRVRSRRRAANGPSRHRRTGRGPTPEPEEFDAVV
jgi:hypothetical protein